MSREKYMRKTSAKILAGSATIVNYRLEKKMKEVTELPILTL